MTYYFMSLLYVLATLLTWLACMMLAIAHNERPRSITWLASVKVRADLGSCTLQGACKRFVRSPAQCNPTSPASFTRPAYTHGATQGIDLTDAPAWRQYIA